MFIVLKHSWTILYPTVCIKKYGITCVTVWNMNSMVWVGVKECEGHACSCWPPLIEGEIADEELDLPPEPVLPIPVTWNGTCLIRCVCVCVCMCVRVCVSWSDHVGSIHMRWGMESRDCSDRQRPVLLRCFEISNHPFTVRKFNLWENLLGQYCNTILEHSWIQHFSYVSVCMYGCLHTYDIFTFYKYIWYCPWRRSAVGLTSRASLANTCDWEWNMPIFVGRNIFFRA